MKTKHAAPMTLLLATVAGGAQADLMDRTSVKLTGYIKVDGLATDYSDGTLPSGNIGRDFYVPGLTPVGSDETESVHFDGHSRQTRFRFSSETDLANGEKISGAIEFDFLVTPEGNERISSSYQPRMRHAFIKYSNFLIGQTWTTFMDTKALPEAVDFIGTTDGITFGRQAMLRYSVGAFDIALENPETTVSNFQAGGRIVTDDNNVPDLVGRYTFKGDWGHVQVAGLVRQLRYEEGTAIDSTDTSYGISVTGKYKIGRDDIRYSFAAGSGLGRYLALNTVNGAVLNENNELQAIDAYAYALSYRHVWDDQWRSTIMWSYFNADNDTALTGLGTTAKTYSTRVNLMYSPSPEVDFGTELSFASRELESGADGNMTRLQVMARYKF